MRLTTAEEMRRLDRIAIEERQIHSIDLMERAADGVAQAVLAHLERRASKCRAAVFCGSGNNGGDGLGAARFLFLAGVKVRVFLVGSYEKLTPDAREEARRLSECGVALEPFDPDSTEQLDWLTDCDAVVDAIFGVGLSRPVASDSLFGRAVETINALPAFVTAADIASGVEADTGRVLGCAVQADLTVTFTLAKIGQFSGEGALRSGEVLVWGIGIPEELVQETAHSTVWTVEPAYAAAVLPARKPDGHKGTFGKVLVVGGSVGYTGAPYLAAAAAMRSGCGLVYLGVPAAIWPVEAAKCVSSMPFPLPDQQGKLHRQALAELRKKAEICDVLAVGPGLGRSHEVTALVLDLLQTTKKPVVLDADGINALEGHIDVLDSRRGSMTILTPHDGEFARLGGDLSGGDRVGTAVDFARRHGCVLVLKGHRTVVATPAGTALVNTTGNSGLSKGGSGDVLTGLIASLLAQGCTAVEAASLGVYLHGSAADAAAADRTPWCMTPEDVISYLPIAIKEL